jgi:hypothetical protein
MLQNQNLSQDVVKILKFINNKIWQFLFPKNKE